MNGARANSPEWLPEAWAGYANEQIRGQIEPLLQAALRKRGWT